MEHSCEDNALSQMWRRREGGSGGGLVQVVSHHWAFLNVLMVRQGRRQQESAGRLEAEIVNTEGALETVQAKHLIFQMKKLRYSVMKGRENTCSRHRGS